MRTWRLFALSAVVLHCREVGLFPGFVPVVERSLGVAKEEIMPFIIALVAVRIWMSRDCEVTATTHLRTSDHGN